MSSGGFCVKARSFRSNNGGNGCSGGGGGGGGGTGTKCGRWNPTAEQVKVLTDLFRSGLRTPSTDQIQKISTQLSFYGKIESKNVFYWFQNHKARERQKRRKISVDFDHHHQKESIFKSPQDIFEVNQAPPPYEQERVIETLQLFPLNPFEESNKAEKMRAHANNVGYIRETNATAATFWPYSCGVETDYPPLDLRLSSL